jgi:hypothetical protein
MPEQTEIWTGHLQRPNATWADATEFPRRCLEDVLLRPGSVKSPHLPEIGCAKSASEASLLNAL